MLVYIAIGIIIGIFIGYRVGMWHALMRLGTAERKIRQGEMHMGKLRK